MLKKLTPILIALAAWLPGLAQVVTYTPDPLYEDSDNIIVYFHADQGSKGLANLAESAAVYAHTGVITNKSKDNSDWKYAPDWSKNQDKYKMTYVSKNLYSLNIGNIHSFYGVPSNEVVEKLAFVFRDASGNKTGKTASGGDIFIDVVSTGMTFNFTSDLKGSTVSAQNPTVTFTLSSNQTADEMWLTINGNEVKRAANVSTLNFPYTFTESGRYFIMANAKKGEKTYLETMTIYYAGSSEQKDYPGGVPKMGPVRNADGTVTFCLAAPDKVGAKLIGSWDGYVQDETAMMYYKDYDGQRYFWKTVEGLDKTSQYLYYFNVDERYNVGDPYAKLVLDPGNDKYIPASVYPNLPEYPKAYANNSFVAVYQENINDFDWTDDDFKAPAKTDLVIYELLLRDFTGTEGKAKGDGNVKLALEKIPYLKALGINAIELLPINEFNGNISWGYNPNFYFAPDKAYGTPDDYKTFINTCHENGIAVILDLVFNQTDWQHPWYRMYDVGSNPMYNADAPHAYSVLNDINQGHPLIRQQWKDVVKYWIEEYHVDGYRFDLVKGLGDNNSYSNSGDAATNAYNASRVANMHAIQEAMNEVNPDAYFINENLAGDKEENEMAAFGMLNWANVNYAGCQYAMGYSNGANLNRMYAPNDNRTWGSTVAYLESHDEERLAYKQVAFGQTAIKNDHAAACRRLGSAAAQMILVPGAHMIWQFSEMGNAQTTKNSDGGNNTDPKIVNWNLLNDPNNKGLYNNYCELIRLRLSNPDLFTKDATFEMQCGSANWTLGRMIRSQAGTKDMITIINPSYEKELTYSVAFTQSDYDIASKSYGTTPSFSIANGTVTVPANSYVVLASKSVAEVENVTEAGDADALYAYGTRGSLTVTNAAAGICVYDLNGRACYANSAATEATISLPAGLYIVRSADQTLKVLVK